VILTGDTLFNPIYRFDVNSFNGYNQDSYNGFDGNENSTNRSGIYGENHVLTITGRQIEFANSDIFLASLWITNNASVGFCLSPEVSIQDGIHLKDSASLYLYSLKNDLTSNVYIESGLGNALKGANEGGTFAGDIYVKNGAGLKIFSDTAGSILKFKGAIKNEGTLSFTGNTQHLEGTVDGGFTVDGGIVRVYGNVSGTVELKSGQLIVEDGGSVERLVQTGGTCQVNGTGAIDMREVSGENVAVENLSLSKDQKLILSGDARLTGNVTIDGGEIEITSNCFGLFSSVDSIVITKNGATINTKENFVSLALPLNHTVEGSIVKKGAGCLGLGRSASMETKVDVREGNLKLVANRLIHRYRFNGDFKDEVSGVAAESKGVSFVDGKEIEIQEGDSNSKYVSFGKNFLPRGKEATIEMWFTIKGDPILNSKLFSFGNVGTERVGMMGFTLRRDANLCRGGGIVSFKSKNKWYYDHDVWHGVNGQSNNYGMFEKGHRYYLATAITTAADGKMKVVWHRYDLTSDTNSYGTNTYESTQWNLMNAPQTAAYLSKNPWSDKMTHVTFDELRVWDKAMSSSEIASSVAAGPDAAVSILNDTLAHRYRFDGTLVDDVTEISAKLNNGNDVTWTKDSTAIHLPGGEAKANKYIDFGSNLLPTSTGETTIELWFTNEAMRRQSKLLYIGNCNNAWLIVSLNEYDRISTSKTTWNISCAIKSPNGGTGDVLMHKYGAEGTLLELDSKLRYHLSVVITTSSEAIFTIRNAVTGEILSMKILTHSAWNFKTMSQQYCWIGDGQWHDTCVTTTIDEFRIWNKALSQSMLTESVLLGPDIIPSPSLSLKYSEVSENPAVTVAGIETFAGATIDLGTLPTGKKDFSKYIQFFDCGQAAFSNIASLRANFDHRPHGRITLAPQLGLDLSAYIDRLETLINGECKKFGIPKIVDGNLVIDNYFYIRMR
jgi:hypothetical protein